MARALLIKLHLYFSAFIAAAIVLVAVSGGHEQYGLIVHKRHHRIDACRHA